MLVRMPMPTRMEMSMVRTIVSKPMAMETLMIAVMIAVMIAILYAVLAVIPALQLACSHKQHQETAEWGCQRKIVSGQMRGKATQMP